MYIQNSELKLDKGIYAQRKNWDYEAKIALAKRRIEEWDVHWDCHGIPQFQEVLSIQTDSRMRRSSMHLIWRN